MKIYRTEREDGAGPFDLWLSHELTDAMVAAGEWPSGGGLEGDPVPYHNQFPCPEEDGIDLSRRMGKVACGCLSMDQLNEWFPEPCRKVLRDNGLHIATYEVPDKFVRKGRTQVVFDKAEAKLIATIPA